MQKWYVEDYLTHKCVKNTGGRTLKRYVKPDDALLKTLDGQQDRLAVEVEV